MKSITLLHCADLLVAFKKIFRMLLVISHTYCCKFIFILKVDFLCNKSMREY